MAITVRFFLIFALAQTLQAAPAELIVELLQSLQFKQLVQSDHPEIKSIKQTKRFRSPGGYQFQIQWQSSNQDKLTFQAVFTTEYRYEYHSPSKNHRFLNISLVPNTKKVIHEKKSPELPAEHKHMKRSAHK